MRDGEMLSEILRAAFQHVLCRDAGGVGGDDGARPAVLGDPAEDPALDGEVLDDHLDDEVALRGAADLLPPRLPLALSKS